MGERDCRLQASPAEMVQLVSYLSELEMWCPRHFAASHQRQIPEPKENLFLPRVLMVLVKNSIAPAMVAQEMVNIRDGKNALRKLMKSRRPLVDRDGIYQS